MGLSEAVSTVIGKYIDFSGRSRRSEYWFWSLAVLMGYVVLALISVAAKPLSFLLIIFYLAILLPTMAVGVRRLHDTGRSGWFLLISLIPIIGGIVLLVFTVTDSTPGANQYGPNPKGV